MKISLIMNPDDIRCKLIKKAAANNGIKCNVLQFYFGENFVSDIKKKIKKLGDIVIYHSNKGYKNKKKEEISRALQVKYKDFLKETILLQNKNILNKNCLIKKLGYKSQQYFNLKRENKKYIIKSFLVNNEKEIKDLLKTKKIKYPFIAKLDGGSRGDNIFLIKNMKELKIFTEKENLGDYIFQNFIENDGDFRLIYLGGKFLGGIKRSNKNSFLNNISRGGKAEIIKDKITLNKIKEIALDVVKTFDADFCGIDIIYDKTKKKYYFLELNLFSQRKGFGEIYDNVNIADLLVKFILKKQF